MNRKEFISKIGTGLLAVTGLELIKTPTVVHATITDNKSIVYTKEEKQKLQDIETEATKNIIDSALNSASNNGIANSTVANAFKQQINFKPAQNISASNFIQQDPTTYSGDEKSILEKYPYKCDIEIEGVTAEHFPIVIFGAADALDSNISSMCMSSDGKISLYAMKQPENDVVVKSIICMHEVDVD